MTPRLTAEAVGDTHEYLAAARPDWTSRMEWIQERGGPWDCDTCGRTSLLVYRCSICGGSVNRDG